MKKIIFVLAMLCNFSIFACDYEQIDTYTLQPVLQRLYGGYWRYEHDELITKNYVYRVIHTLKYETNRKKHLISVIQKQSIAVNYDCNSCEPEYFLLETSSNMNNKGIKLLYNKKIDAPINEEDVESQFDLIRIKENKHIVIHQGSYSYQGILSAKISVYYNANKILEVDPSYESNEDYSDDKWLYQTRVSYNTNTGLIQFRRIGTMFDIATNKIAKIDSVETYQFKNDKFVMILK